MPDEASLAGKGRDILLPKHGNPFQQSVDASADPTADFAARNPSSHDDRNVLPNTTDPLPDLAPSDVAALFKESGAAVISSAAASPMAASPKSPVDEIRRAPSMSSTEDPDTKVFDGSWLQAPANITASGDEEALPAHDADDVIPAVGILSAPKPTPTAQPVSTSTTPATVSAPSVSPTSSGLRLPPLATSPVPSTSASSATMTPSTPQPKPVEPKPATPTPSSPLAERFPPSAANTPAKPADAGFKPANPFASADAKPPSASTPATSPTAADANKALVNFAAGSSPSQPTASSPSASMSRLSVSALSDPLAPGASVIISGLPTPPVVEQEAMIKFFITDARLDDLWTRIDAVEKRTIGDNNLGAGDRRKALDNIRGARNLLLGGKQNYEDALRYVVEVESDMLQATRLKGWSTSYGLLLLLYNIVWLAALAVLLTYSKQVTTTFTGTGVDQVFFITVLCGGLGGVSGGLRSMWVHIAKDRDFDPQFLMWYIINPILGAVLAIFSYWVVQLGLVAVTGAGSSGNGVLVFYVLGWLVGFQQNVAYQLVEQAIKMFKRDETGKSPDAATKPPATTTDKPKS